MFPFIDITPLLLQTVGAALTDPLFLVVVAVVALQYWRMGKVKESFFGLKPRGLWRDVLLAAGFGLLGGVVASYLMVLVGVTLSNSGLMYLWPLAILLMLIDARFLCFAYAGGILALSSLVLGWPQVSVPQVLGLVAVLHMVEAFLILVSGHLGAVPTFIKSPGGKVVGGFALQKFWPIPLAALIVVGHTSGPAGGISLPDWWPLIKGGLADNADNLLYTLMPVVAGLGYGDLAAARTPEQKSRISSIILAVYSMILLVLAVLAAQSRLLAVAAAIFSPLGHELVIYLGKQLELTRPPLYQPPVQGVKVLDVIPGYPAWQAGLRSGDIILEVNGMQVSSRQGLEFALGIYPQIQLTYWSARENNVIREGIEFADRHMLGILPVPEGNEENYMELSTNGPIRRWFNNRLRKQR